MSLGDVVWFKIFQCADLPKMYYRVVQCVCVYAVCVCAVCVCKYVLVGTCSCVYVYVYVYVCVRERHSLHACVCVCARCAQQGAKCMCVCKSVCVRTRYGESACIIESCMNVNTSMFTVPLWYHIPVDQRRRGAMHGMRSHADGPALCV